MMLVGSSAALIWRIASSSAAGLVRANSDFFKLPMPCSAEIELALKEAEKKGFIKYNGEIGILKSQRKTDASNKIY